MTTAPPALPGIASDRRLKESHKLTRLLLDDAVGVGGPDKRFRFAAVLAEVAVNRRLQVDQ